MSPQEVERYAKINTPPQRFAWQDNPSIQKVLDTLISIIAQEYIQIAKQNPTVFSEIASHPSGVRNDKL